MASTVSDANDGIPMFARRPGHGTAANVVRYLSYWLTQMHDRDEIKPGAIFATADDEYRVIVYYVRDGAYPALFADDFPFTGGSHGFCGGNVRARFRARYPRHVGQMRFEGAWKLYKKEARRR